VEILRGPPYFFDDHFSKATWDTWQATKVIYGDLIDVTIAAGYTAGAITHPLGATISTDPYRFLVVRATAFYGTNWRIEVPVLGAGYTIFKIFTDTGLKIIDLYAENGGAHFNYNQFSIRVDGAQGDFVQLDYVATCNYLSVLVPVDVGDVVEELTITRPLLAQGVSGAQLTLQNFGGALNGQINKHDIILIWLSRVASDLGSNPACKVFGGRIVNPTNQGRGQGAFFLKLDCHGHAYELNNPPGLLQKLYPSPGTNGRTIIEDALGLCYYVAKHPVASKWFDNTGAEGSTDDRINSTHEVEYDEVKPKTVIDEIAEKASNPAGIKGFDIYETPSGVLVGHLKNSLDFVSPISSITPENYSKSEDVHRIKNKIKVYGARERTNPSDKDSWTESLTNWTSDGTLSLNADRKLGSCSVQATKIGASVMYMQLTFSQISALFRAGYRNINYWLKFIHSSGVKPSSLMIYLFCPNYNNSRRTYQYDFPDDSVWGQTEGKKIGPTQNHEWEVVMSGNPNWANIQGVRFDVTFPSSGDITMRCDALFFGERPFEGSAEDATSQNNYGIRVPEPEVDEALKSDADCLAKAQSIRDFLKDPVVSLQNVFVDGDYRYNPGDRQRLIVSNDNLDNYFRILSIKHQIRGPTWDTILTLSEEPEYIDYVIRKLRETDKLLERIF